MLNEMGLNINGVKALRQTYTEIIETYDNYVSFFDYVKILSESIGLTSEQMQANKQSNKSKGRKKKEV